MPPVALGQAEAGIVGQTGRAVGNIGHRRHDIGSLAIPGGVPQLLGVPRAQSDRHAVVLVAAAPAAVAAFDDVDPACLVAVIGVVVAGEEIAVLVEGELLGIAQTGRDNLQLRAVGITAQHGTGVGTRHGPALGLDVEAAIAAAEIDFAVRAKAQSVHVMTDEGDMHAIAVMQQAALASNPDALRVAEQPEIGNAGVPDVAVAGQQAGADTVGQVVKAVREDRGPIGLAAAGRIFQEADTLVLDGPLGQVLADMLLHHGDAILDGAAGKVVVEPVHMVAHIRHAVVQPERLGHVEAILKINAKAHRIGQQRLRSEQAGLEAPGHLNAFAGEAGFVGERGDLGCIGSRTCRFLFRRRATNNQENR